MDEQHQVSNNSASSSSSWLMRAHFSRAVCYRPGSIVSPVPSLLPVLKASKNTSVLHRTAPDPFDTAVSEVCRRASETNHAPCVEISESNPEFCFPSPVSSSFSDSSTSCSKGTWDGFSPVRDHDPGTDLSLTPSPPFCSVSTDGFTDRQSPDLSYRKNEAAARELVCSCDMQRVPSWSHYFSSHGNEKAVLSAQKWMVDLSQLLLGERFACGNHSRLYHGIYSNSAVAVKVIRQPDENGPLADRLEQIFTQEVTILSCLHHRNVIKFIAACKKPPVLCVITEYLPGGSLRSFLHKREGRRLPTSQIVRMALDVACGMEYMHLKGVIHRDLKSENLVLSEGECLKIVDFGVSCFEAECDYRADDPGTYRWMAPEMLRHNQYTRKVDVYSFGIVLWELVTTRLPYEEMSAVQAAFAVLHKNARPSIPPDCPPPLNDLMCQCWCTDSEKRPEFWEILRTLATLERSLDGCNVPTGISPERHRFLPGCLQCE